MSSNNPAPSSRNIRRFKSADEFEFSLDAIGEEDVLVPSRPRRHRSVDNMDTWMWAEDSDDEDIFASVNFGLDDDDDSSSDEEEDDLLDDDCSALLEGMSIVESSTHSRPRNLDHNANSFSTLGSSMTAAQQQHPGRFVTPMNSITMQENDLCAVQAIERLVVEPHRFLQSDISFRPPLTRAASSKSSSCQDSVAKQQKAVFAGGPFGSIEPQPQDEFHSQRIDRIMNFNTSNMPALPSFEKNVVNKPTLGSLPTNGDDDDGVMLPFPMGLKRKTSIRRLNDS